MTEIFLKTLITLKNIYLIPFTQVLTGLRHSHIHTCVCAKWITKRPFSVFRSRSLYIRSFREISLVKISILCNHCVIFILNRIKASKHCTVYWYNCIIYLLMHVPIYKFSKVLFSCKWTFFHSITKFN